MRRKSRFRDVYERGANARCYSIWRNMHRRCYDKKFKFWYLYGGRGIKVSERWHRANPEGFLNFFLDMGNPPNEMSLNRIDPNKSYEFSNCQWATAKQQRHAQRAVKSLDSFSADEIGKNLSNRHRSEQLKAIKHLIGKKK